MSQQTIELKGKGGADSRRVLDALTPLNGTAAPTVNAVFLGQIFIDTATPAVYMAIKVGDATPANDWQRIDAYDA
jgi:hypothetical protein